MDVFELREKLVSDYEAYTTSFVQIEDARIREYVGAKLDEGLLWPEPLIQLNPSFDPGAWIDDLVASAALSPECANIFRIKNADDPTGKPLRLHKHQEDAVHIARKREHYVLTTGTGSGKSLAYIVPIVDAVLRDGPGKGVQAIIVYPMNALANSQLRELEKFINLGYPDNKGPVRFRRYTGQENELEREEIIASPPDILLTNYVMLEYILTRPRERDTLVKAAQGLRFLVLDELHTYRGRQGADVALLVRRVRDALDAAHMQCVGTSATLAGGGTFAEQQEQVAAVATSLFGAPVHPECVIGETLRRATPEPEEGESWNGLLRKRLEIEPSTEPSYESFVADPLFAWIETTFGVQRDASDRLVRNMPITVSTAAEKLSNLTGVDLKPCEYAIKGALLQGFAVKNPETGFPIFAFRLHQFISRGDTVYASLESEADRHVTVYGQQFVPKRHGTLLYPLSFCRQCGQEFYSVRREKDPDGPGYVYSARPLGDRLAEEGGEPGFIYVDSDDPWPTDHDTMLKRVPEDWLEEHRGTIRLRKNRQQYLPHPTRANAEGKDAEEGTDCAFFPAPFRFCPSCGVSYGFRQTSDYAKRVLPADVRGSKLSAHYDVE